MAFPTQDGQAYAREDVALAARRTLEQLRRIGAEFLVAEVNVALTFLHVAMQTSGNDVRRRNCENARAACETVQHFLPTVSPSESQRRELADKLASLGSQLVAVGYSLD